MVGRDIRFIRVGLWREKLEGGGERDKRKKSTVGQLIRSQNKANVM
jgi:hypothetical protein